MANNWILQIVTAEWVLWSYGKEGPVRVDPAVVITDGIRFEFELPLVERLPAPVEHERRCTLGWRFWAEPGYTGSDWRLADSTEDAIRAARAYLDKLPLYSRAKLEPALDNICEQVWG